jgi:peptidoglycan/xylan/chitin deacetylase (PgdA/CDA1 family)
MPLNRLAKSTARRLLHGTGWLRGVRFWNRRAFRILMYHDFPSMPGLQESLARQCAHIRRYYHVVSMLDVARHLHEGAPLPSNAVAVTVDDGSRDFLINAYPVFHAHKIPVTVYLVSGFLDRRFWFWWDQVIYLVGNSRRPAVELSFLGGLSESFSLETLEDRQETIERITKVLKKLNPDERRRAVEDQLAKMFEVDLPSDPPPSMAPLAWSEVRRLADNGVEVGAHTVTHSLLSTVLDPRDLHDEIHVSKKRIEEELKRPVAHFCYPYGKWGDFDDKAVAEVKQSGFLTAVTAEHGLNTRTSDPLRLKRFSVDPMFPEFYFHERVSGLHLG